MKNILLTLCIIEEDGRVLLGHKKRGLGTGYLNGFGGKVEPGEHIHDAAHREVHEEAGVELKELTKHGELFFTFSDKPEEKMEVHVYRGKGVVGEPRESDEMRPEWFSIDSIPYDRMWADDIIWLPRLLEGKEFVGTFHMDEEHQIVESEFIIKGE